MSADGILIPKHRQAFFVARKLMKTQYELTNNQRQYFGLSLVTDSWNKIQLSDTIFVYYQNDEIVKILNYSFGYCEYDTNIETNQRQSLIYKRIKGKEQKLTVAKLLKIKGCGISFSGSFEGGGIHIYDNRRNLFFIKGFAEDGEIKSYDDIEKWIANYIAKVPPNYFEWLNKELLQKRVRIKVKEGDIIAFKISQKQYGFARVIVDVFSQRQNINNITTDLYWFHPRSLIVAIYGYYADTLKVDLDKLITKGTLPTICIFDLDVYRGEMPIIGHRPLSTKEKLISLPNKRSTSMTIPYTKSDIENFIATNEVENS